FNADFRKHVSRHGGDFRRLRYHAVTRSQGRSYLPGEQVERQVPRGNAAYHAMRMAHGIVNGISSLHIMRLRSEMLNSRAVKAHVTTGPGYIYRLCQLQRLAIVY